MSRFLTCILISLLVIPLQGYGVDDNRGESWLEVNASSSDEEELDKHYNGGAFVYDEHKINQVRNYVRYGLSVLAKHDGDPKNDYFGVEMSSGLNFGNRLSLFVGAGLFAGETEACTERDEEKKLCKENLAIGVIPEIGVRLKPTRDIFISAYMRKYLLTNEPNSFVSKGLSIGLRY